jgi:hypothetical protein
MQHQWGWRQLPIQWTAQVHAQGALAALNLADGVPVLRRHCRSHEADRQRLLARCGQNNNTGKIVYYGLIVPTSLVHSATALTPVQFRLKLQPYPLPIPSQYNGARKKGQGHERKQAIFPIISQPSIQRICRKRQNG